MLLKKIIRHRKLLPYCFEALRDLAVCKYQILFVPFSKYAKDYGYPHCETLREDMERVRSELYAIRIALRVVPKCVPWKSKCLDQAMTAQRMLKRRGLQSTLYFGVVRAKEGGALNAHAWLRCGDRWMVGYHPHINYTIVGTYACGI